MKIWRVGVGEDRVEHIDRVKKDTDQNKRARR
jgi:hypothetical protein